MNPGQIVDGFSVAPQLMPEHIASLAASGFKAIINNRPDGERGFYPGNAEMAALAEKNGMEYRFIPVNPMAMTMDPVVDFAKAMEELEGPVVAYCASGRRSAMIWALANANEISADEILSACAAQGHDLNMLRPMLMQMAQAA